MNASDAHKTHTVVPTEMMDQVEDFAQESQLQRTFARLQVLQSQQGAEERSHGLHLVQQDVDVVRRGRVSRQHHVQHRARHAPQLDPRPP